MGSKNEAIGMKIGMDLTSISADGVALSDFGLRARSARNRARGAQKCCFWLFSASPCILKGQSIKTLCLASNFG